MHAVGMWRGANGILVLEPGEVEALMGAARDAARRCPWWHPRRAMLEAVAVALTTLAAADGVAVAPAGAALLRRAARAHVRAGHVKGRAEGDAKGSPAGVLGLRRRRGKPVAAVARRVSAEREDFARTAFGRER